MEPGGLWWTNDLNSALPPQRLRPDTQPEHQDPVSHMAQKKRERKKKKEEIKKERREQLNQKTNPPMITSAKNYTKKKIIKK